MLIDITFKVTPDIVKNDPGTLQKSLAGHTGTHFDVMNKEFPLEYTRRDGIVFDVSGVRERDICAEDIDISKVEKGMFVAFYSNFIEEVGNGAPGYFSGSPQLSNELIDQLLDSGVSIIALDFGGIRRGKEHVPKDQLCADRGTFVIENLCNLKALVEGGGRFIAHTYPMSYAGITGLPCRVIAEI